MRRFIFFALSLVLVAVFLGQATAQTDLQALVFTRVTLIDATGSRAEPNMTVVIIGDRIVDIAETVF
jgi:hypothetical protein